MKKYKYLFGPLMSRRFGRSLGIDLCPMKTCSYDCVFCQLGRTPTTTTERSEMYPLKDICDELSEWLDAGDNAKYITLAGCGEPTLYSRFGELIDFIHSKTDIPVLILSNGSLFNLPEVRTAAAKADVVKLSMSAWNQQLLELVNRPAKGITFDEMLEGEIAFRRDFVGKLVVEVFLLGGMNAIQADVAKIAECVARIKPDTIHLNTVTRPAAEDFAYAVDKEKLERFAELFTPKAEIPPEVLGSPVLNGKVDETKIIDLVRRRPVTLEQLAETFGIHPNEVAKITGKLIRDDVFVMETRDAKTYFKVV